MSDIESARFETKLNNISRELESLHLLRQQRHADFIKRLQNMKERCDRITNHRITRLETEYVAFDMAMARYTPVPFENSFVRSASFVDIRSLRDNGNFLNSQSKRPHTPPTLKMELSFDCRESLRKQRLVKENEHRVPKLLARGRFNNMRLEKEIDKAVNVGAEIEMKKRNMGNGNTKESQSNTGEGKEDNNNIVKQYVVHNNSTNLRGRGKFRRIGNKVNNVMKMINYRRHTVSTDSHTEYKPNQGHLNKLRQSQACLRRNKSASDKQKQHTLKRNERNSRIRLYSDESDCNNGDVDHSFKRVMMTIRSVKQFERKKSKAKLSV